MSPMVCGLKTLYNVWVEIIYPTSVSSIVIVAASVVISSVVVLGSDCIDIFFFFVFVCVVSGVNAR